MVPPEPSQIPDDLNAVVTVLIVASLIVLVTFLLLGALAMFTRYLESESEQRI